MKAFFVIIGFICIVGSLFFFMQAYDKYTNYYQSSSGKLNQNAYVGGDAYNYIINGNYFTGYSVLGVGSLLLSFLCFGIAYLAGQTDILIYELRAINRTSAKLSRQMIEPNNL